MKYAALILSTLLIINPVFVSQADSLVKTAVKLKAADNIVNGKGNKHDSGLKKAAKLKATKKVSKSNDSGLERAVKYKIIKDM